MTYTEIAWIVAGLVCSALCWRAWPKERRRVLAGWTLVALDIGFRLAAWQLQLRWLSAAAASFQELAVIQFLAIFLFQFVIARGRIHVIFGELAMFIAYVGVVFRLLTNLGTDVNGLIATSTVVTAIAGLAMQDILMNSVGGVVLQLEGEIGPGDFIQTGHGAGWVRKVRTRYTSVETPDGDAILIPNQLLNKGAVQIVSRVHRVAVPFQVSYEHQPPHVMQVVQAALRMSSMDGVAHQPLPVCLVSQFAREQVEYMVLVWFTNPGRYYAPTSEVLTRVYFALLREGIPLKGIARRVDLVAPQETGTDEQVSAVRIANLGRNPVFGILTREELELVAQRLKRVSFAPGETIVRQGEEGQSLYLVVKGRLRVVLSLDAERSKELAVLEEGSLFGEMSMLTGERRSASVVAIDQVDCDRLDKADFAEVLERRPEVAYHISMVMCERQSSLELARELLSAPLESVAQNLRTRIESFFGLRERKI